MTKFFPLAKFVPESCKGCKGHANWLLDCDYSRKEDRDLLSKILDNYDNSRTDKSE